MESLHSAYATVARSGEAGSAPAAGPPAPGAEGEDRPAPADLRGTGERTALRFPAGDRVVVSGLPGSGKSTLIRRTVGPGGARTVDSQDTRERWARRMPRCLPYALYRPLVRLAHFAWLHRALSSGESVVVHDCGAQGWVRGWLARDSRRRGRGLHLVLLDVPPRTALMGQALRGRGVSGYAFLRHRRAVARLIRDAESGRLAPLCDSVTLLDREGAERLDAVLFDG